jgi:hypothetical protein
MGICFVQKLNDRRRNSFSEGNDSNNINDDETKKNLEETIFKFAIQETNEISTVNKDMYDAIFSCESIKKLFDEGWKYKLSYKFIKRFYGRKNQILPFVCNRRNK